MNEHLTARQRRRELLITLAYTIFSVLMIIVTTIEGWPLFYIPLIVAEMGIVWWSYARGFHTYNLRAFMVTCMTCINIFLYGIQGGNFFVLIPTLCVEFVLLSLYEIPRIMDFAIAQTMLLFIYHMLIKQTFVMPESSVEKNRLILQLLSLVVLVALCIYRIYHHVQEENDYIKLEEQAQKEQKIKDDFMANTSHELRTPVNTISGMCEILLQKSLPEDIHSGVLDIQMTGVELQNIVTDIMDYAALESDTMVLEKNQYNITSTLNDVMNMTVFANRDKNLEIIFDCDPNIPCLLEGDEQQLRRVLNNLISNAIKFTNEGGVTVGVRFREEAYGINLIVSVKDTGVGLSLEEKERILRDFYQSDADRNRRSSGVGLGLTISAALIKKMGGFLTIKSEEGKGSEFSFAIPQKVLDDKPCISLNQPGAIKLVWYYSPQTPVPSMRDSFVDHIKHFSDYFGIISQRAGSLEECKRRVSSGSQGVHLIIGKNEYMQDKTYFDELSEAMPIILVADRNDVPETSSRIHVLYKPYNAMMLAEIFNGREQIAKSVRKKQKKFIAPTAKVLVVDDNLMNLKVVEGLMRKYKIKIVAATSGEEALAIIESKDFDFVFMDHMMPGMDGVECFHLIREKVGTYFKQVPIIALTANAIAGSREMFLAEGFNEFIAKPIDTAMLNEILHRFIPASKQIDEDQIDMEGSKYVQPESASRVPKSTKKSAAAAKSSGAESSKFTKAEKETPEKSVKTQTEDVAAPADPFESLSGIDKETALMYCGSAEDFLELAEVYCDSGVKYEKTLKETLADSNLKDYAITAHAIKSTSKTLGALELSELALGQEMAAKEENLDLVSEKHEEFLKAYADILGKLRLVLPGAEQEPAAKDNKKSKSKKKSKSEASEIENWEQLKKDIAASLEAYEIKAFEDCIEKVRGQKLNGEKIEDALSEVLTKASNFDFDGALESLEKIGGDA